MDNISTSNQQIDVVCDDKRKIIYSIIKRVSDIFLSLIAMLLLSPIFLVVALVIRVDSKGKIVFGHERIGKDMKKIKVYKLITLLKNRKKSTT